MGWLITVLTSTRPHRQLLNNPDYVPSIIKNQMRLTCKWLLTSSLVRPSTFINSLICLGVATVKKTQLMLTNILIQHSNLLICTKKNQRKKSNCWLPLLPSSHCLFLSHLTCMLVKAYSNGSIPLTIPYGLQITFTIPCNCLSLLTAIPTFTNGVSGCY